MKWLHWIVHHVEAIDIGLIAFTLCHTWWLSLLTSCPVLGRIVSDLQGNFEEALVLHYTDPVPSEDTGMPLESRVRVVVARECSAGDVLRVALPELSMQDLAGNTLMETMSAESACIVQPLRELPRAAHYLKFLGAFLGVFFAVGLALSGWLFWSAATRDASTEVERGVGHSKGAAMAVALATLALFLQGVFATRFKSAATSFT